MRKIYLIVAFFVIGLFSIQSSNATHLMGMDIQYTHIFGETYQITFSFYRDCGGTTAPGTVSIDITSPSACGTAGNVVLTQVAGTGIEVSPLCATAVSTCDGGTIQGVEQYVYQGIYTFPAKCDDWELEYGSCCRNSVITTGPADEDFAIQGTLDNTGTINNNSPQFTTLPVPYICLGQEFNYNHGAFDPDGDSLVFSLVDALATTGGALVTYNPPITATYPITDVSGTIVFDTRTGAMVVTPDAVQVAVIAIRVDEYRDGVLIGSIMRDIQVVVQNCTNVQPNESGSGGIINNGGGIRLDSNSMEACPGDALLFDVIFEDGNAGDSVILSTNIATVLPGATFTSTGMNPVTGTVSWTPTGNDAGFHNFVIVVQDNGCPILGTQVYSYDIFVNTGTTAGPDITYCPGGLTPQLSVTGGSVFTWSVLSGDAITGANFSCNPCSNPVATPANTTTYIVTSNLSAICQNTDTITVNVSSGFSVNMNPTSATICYGEQTQISANPTGGGAFTYSWAPAGTLTDATIQNPFADPTVSTTYYATVTNTGTGCSVQNSVPVTISGVAPTVLIEPSDTSICAGQSVNLDATAANLPATCGLNGSGCSTTETYKLVGNGTTTNTSTTPFRDGWHDHRVQYLFTAAELNAAGLIGGTITELQFNVTSIESSGAETYNGFNIRMGCSALTAFATTTFEGGTSTVFSAGSYTPSMGANTFTLNTAYDWDGVSSLIVEICWDNNAYQSSNASLVASTTTGFTSVLYDYADGDAGCSLSSPFTSSDRPNILFRSCETVGSFTYTWTPATGLNNAGIEDPIASPTSSTNYLLEVFDAGSGCTGFATTQFNVGAAFTLNMRPDTTICYGGNAPMYATPSLGGAYTYNWSPTSGLSNPFSPTPDASPAFTQTYSVSVDNGGCIRTGSSTITVASQPITGVVDDSVLCPDQTGQLDVSFASGCEEYTARSITHVNPDNNGWTGTTASFDGIHTGIAIGFDFEFYCNTYSTINVAADGWVSFTATSGEYYNTALPDAGTPNNMIAAGWDDLGTSSGDVKYKLKGTSPNQTFEIYWDNVSFYTGTNTIETRIILYETTNVVEIHMTDIPNNSSLITVGIENLDGTDGMAVTGMNNQDFTATNEAWSFTPTPLGGPYTYAWSPTTNLSDPAVQNPTVSDLTATTTYQVIQVDQASGGTCPSIGTVTVYPDTTNTLTAGPDLYSCSTGNFTMDATTTGTLPTLGCAPYTGSSITYVAPTAGGWSADLGLGDDAVSGAISLGFDFDFYCNTYSEVYVNSNGQIMFGTATSSYQFGSIPDNFTPDNFIAVCGSDLDPPDGGNIRTKMTGTAPNRIFHVVYNGVVHYLSTNTVTAVVLLYETSNIIEIHNVDVESNAGSMLQGIENSDGTEGVAVPGRNYTTWTATADAYRFTPGPILTSFNWTDGSFMDDSTAEDPIATISTQGIYDFEVSIIGQNCTLRDTVIVTVDNGDTLYWTGAVDQDWFNIANWGGCYIPSCGKSVVIPAIASKMPIISANGAEVQTIEIEPGASLTIDPTFDLDVCGDFINLGTFSANQSSTVDFVSPANNQSISGNFTGANSFGHLHVNKNAGIEVDLATSIDITGDFVVSTGRFDSNSNYIKVGGDFMVYEILGFSYRTGTLEFNGSSQQDFYINK